MKCGVKDFRDVYKRQRYAQWNIKVHFSPFTSEWNIEGKSYDKGNVRAYNTSELPASMPIRLSRKR